jgi:predicted RNA-binding Zn-ribbon protein involved in translation (DUF1610 family)
MELFTRDGALLVDEGFEVRESGELAAGSLVCVGCGYSVALELDDDVPRCPACGESRFRRASMFESRTLDAEAISPAPTLPTWLEAAREGLDETGRYVAYE